MSSHDHGGGVPFVPDVLSHALARVSNRTAVKEISSSVGLNDLLQHMRDYILVPEKGHLLLIRYYLYFSHFI